MMNARKPVTALVFALAFPTIGSAATVGVVDGFTPNIVAAPPSVFTTTAASPATPLNSGAGIPQREAFGTFDIEVQFTTPVSAAQQAAFTAAEAFWENRIVGYASAAIANFLDANFPALVIQATIAPIDGEGNVLGSAGSTNQVVNGPAGAPGVNIVSVEGEMTFDSADVAALETAGTFEDVVVHEMAHVIGFSAGFWQYVGAVDDSGSDTSYTGDIALAIYNDEFGLDTDFIPLEERGGAGTAFSHWDEVGFGGNGDETNPELMTGFLEGPTYLSRTTLGAFDDIGYVTIETVAAIPLPPAFALILVGLGGLVGVRRRDIVA